MAMFNGIEAGLIPAVPNSSGSSFARQHAQSKQDQDKARNAVNKKLRVSWPYLGGVNVCVKSGA